MMKIDATAFFDTEAVAKAASAQERNALSRFGAFVRQRAKTSIKKAPALRLKAMDEEQRKRYKTQVALAKYYGKPRPKLPRVAKSSRPGTPPISRTGLLRQFIFFAYDWNKASVVIGPAKLNKPGAAPNALEYGGTTQAGPKNARRTVKIAARPFMRPAFDAELPKAASMWADSIK